jgi:hypothetical protein
LLLNWTIIFKDNLLPKRGKKTTKKKKKKKTGVISTPPTNTEKNQIVEQRENSGEKLYRRRESRERETVRMERETVKKERAQEVGTVVSSASSEPSGRSLLSPLPRERHSTAPRPSK